MVKDPYKEFRGKTKLNEREVNLLKRRMNDPVAYAQMGTEFSNSEGFELTVDQIKKGYKWLMNLWLTPKGVERKNNPFGHREMWVLKHFKTIRLSDFYDAGNYYRSYQVPMYSVYAKDGSRFDYIVVGGGIKIVG